jgi:hypothetical protein
MIQLAFVILVILHALENALKRKKRLRNNDYRDIKKLPEVIIYSILSFIIGLLGYQIGNFQIWYMVALAVVTRMVFFDISFNIFSGRNPSYENPKGNSLTDKIEQVIPFWHRFIIYTTIYIILLCS